MRLNQKPDDLRYIRVSNAIQAQLDREDNARVLRRCIYVVLALAGVLIAYALAWLVVDAPLWPFGGMK